MRLVCLSCYGLIALYPTPLPNCDSSTRRHAAALWQPLTGARWPRGHTYWPHLHWPGPHWQVLPHWQPAPGHADEVVGSCPGLGQVAHGHWPSLHSSSGAHEHTPGHAHVVLRIDLGHDAHTHAPGAHLHSGWQLQAPEAAALALVLDGQLAQWHSLHLHSPGPHVHVDVVSGAHSHALSDFLHLQLAHLQSPPHVHDAAGSLAHLHSFFEGQLAHWQLAHLQSPPHVHVCWFWQLHAAELDAAGLLLQHEDILVLLLLVLG